MRKIILFILSLLCFGGIHSQLKLADILFNNFEYKTAAKIYSESSSLSQKQLENHALCYFYTNDFKKSIPVFKKALKNKPNDFILNYNYSTSLKSTGKYKSAKKVLTDLFIEDSLNKRIFLDLESINYLEKLDTSKAFNRLVNFNKVNTASSEFSPSFFDEGIYYIAEKGNKKSLTNNISLVSNNDSLTIKEKKEFTEKLNSILSFGNTISTRTYVNKVDLNIPMLFKTFNDPIPDSTVIRNEEIISHKNFNVTSFNVENSNDKIFYTRHPYLTNSNAGAPLNPLIYRGKMDSEKKKIVFRRRIPVRFLSSSAGSGEVCVTSDGETIYFVSDKKKGFGQTDIYTSHKTKSGKWGKAINLGPLVNSPYREESPRIYDDSILYFSSNGFPGYGKADIFKCKIIKDSVYDVKLLPYPINSNGDDIHFVLHPFDESIAILNSNRSTGKGEEDIYFAHMVPISPYVKGYVRLNRDSSLQKNTIVRLLNKDNEEIQQFQTGASGKYRFSLKKNKLYKVVATKKNFYGDTLVLSDSTLFRHERRDITLKGDKTIQGYTVKRTNNERVPNVKIEISTGIRSKKLSIYSDENGFYQFAFNKDSMLLLEGLSDSLWGSKEFFIDTNYLIKKKQNLKLDPLFKRFKVKVLDQETKEIQADAIVYLINIYGNKIDSALTDSTGHVYFNLKTAKDYEMHAFKGKADGIANIHTSQLAKNTKDIDVYITTNYTPTIGKIIDTDSEEPLNSVKITIVDSTTNAKDLSYTNKLGDFELHIHENNIYYLIIEKRDYFTKTLVLNIGDSVPKIIDLNKEYNLSLKKSGFLIEPIYFDFKSHKITKESKLELDKLASFLKNNRNESITIFGYTDCQGTKEYLSKNYNKILGKNRGISVRRYLHAKGIPNSRVTVIGRGSVNFLNSCFTSESCTDQEHRENRRCEFQLNDP